MVSMVKIGGIAAVVIEKKIAVFLQVSKNIFNKNDNNVGLLRTVKKVWIQEEQSKQ